MFLLYKANCCRVDSSEDLILHQSSAFRFPEAWISWTQSAIVYQLDSMTSDTNLRWCKTIIELIFLILKQSRMYLLRRTSWGSMTILSSFFFCFFLDIHFFCHKMSLNSVNSRWQWVHLFYYKLHSEQSSLQRITIWTFPEDENEDFFLILETLFFIQILSQWQNLLCLKSYVNIIWCKSKKLFHHTISYDTGQCQNEKITLSQRISFKILFMTAI